MTIKTEFWRKPIPTSAFDWHAINADNYDVDYDYESGSYTSKCPQGFGATEAAAIADLMQQIEEEENARINA